MKKSTPRGTMKWRITIKKWIMKMKSMLLSFHMHGRIVELFISCRHVIEEEIPL
jgi:hypothetical protein